MTSLSDLLRKPMRYGDSCVPQEITKATVALAFAPLDVDKFVQVVGKKGIEKATGKKFPCDFVFFHTGLVICQKGVLKKDVIPDDGVFLFDYHPTAEGSYNVEGIVCQRPVRNIRKISTLEEYIEIEKRLIADRQSRKSWTSFMGEQVASCCGITPKDDREKECPAMDTTQEKETLNVEAKKVKNRETRIWRELFSGEVSEEGQEQPRVILFQVVFGEIDRKVLVELLIRWMAAVPIYHLLAKNCQHFCAWLLDQLKVQEGSTGKLFLVVRLFRLLRQLKDMYEKLAPPSS